jgi:hypothetical protein
MCHAKSGWVAGASGSMLIALEACSWFGNGAPNQEHAHE